MDTGRQNSPAGAGVMQAVGAAPRTQVLESLRQSYDALQSMPQGQGTAGLAPHLQLAAADGILNHAERDVRLWSAKCLAEALRIAAPEPPLDSACLLAVIKLFLEQVLLLPELDGALFVHGVGLLERLAELRAFMLIFDCETPEESLVALTRAVLCAGRSRACSHLESTLVSLLVDTLREADEVPKVAVFHLVAELASGHRDKGAQVAGGVARASLRALGGGSGLATAVSDLVQNALYMPAASAGSVQAADSEHASTDVLPGTAVSLLELVGELFALKLALVARVLPHLRADLQSHCVERRGAAAAVVGRILAVESAPGEAATSGGTAEAVVEVLPSLLDAYLERFDDPDDSVRGHALDAAAGLIAAAAESPCAAMVVAAKRTLQHVVERCLDPCLTIRIRAVEVAAETAMSGGIGGLRFVACALPEVFRRALDKKKAVREFCIESMGALYQEHALLAWAEGRQDDAKLLLCVPQILCEAFLIFTSNRLGHVERLEECIEQCLGLHAKLGAEQRVLVLAGFHFAASQSDNGAKGLRLLLERKRDANTAMRRFLDLRVKKGSAVFMQGGESGSLAMWRSTGSEIVEFGREAADDEAAKRLKELLRLSPAAEDQACHRLEATESAFRVLDAIRDRALWTHLDRLFGDSCESSNEAESTISTEHLGSLIGELDRLLRVHRLAELAPMIRRALLVTWMLPDQVVELLSMWRGVPTSKPCDVAPLLATSVRRIVSDFPLYFAGAFLSHVDVLAQHLAVTAADDAEAALNALAAMGTWVQAGGRALCNPAILRLDVGRFVETLIQAPSVLTAETMTSASPYRRIIRALGILPADSASDAEEKILHWAESRRDAIVSASDVSDVAAALGLAAACAEALSMRLGRPVSDCFSDSSCEGWRTVASKALDDCDSAEGQRAAVEMLVALGDVTPIESLLNDEDKTKRGKGTDSNVVAADFKLYVALAALRGIRRGLLRITSRLLNLLAAWIATASGEGAAALIASMGQFRRRGTARLVDGLRVCVTLPAVLAIGPSPRAAQTEAARRLLKETLMEAARQAEVRQVPLLDAAVAFFLHFFARQAVVEAEASTSASPFHSSMRLASPFVEALVRGQPGVGMAAVLRVVENTNYFVDRERPETHTLLQRAAAVIRHAAERVGTDVGGSAAALAATGSSAALGAERFMPTELFAEAFHGGCVGVPSPPSLLPPAPAVADGDAMQESPLEAIEAPAGAPHSLAPASLPTPAAAVAAPALAPTLAQRPRSLRAAASVAAQASSVESSCAASANAGGAGKLFQTLGRSRRTATASVASSATTTVEGVEATPKPTRQRRRGSAEALPASATLSPVGLGTETPRKRRRLAASPSVVEKDGTTASGAAAAAATTSSAKGGTGSVVALTPPRSVLGLPAAAPKLRGCGAAASTSTAVAAAVPQKERRRMASAALLEAAGRSAGLAPEGVVPAQPVPRSTGRGGRGRGGRTSRGR